METVGLARAGRGFPAVRRGWDCPLVRENLLKCVIWPTVGVGGSGSQAGCRPAVFDISSDGGRKRPSRVQRGCAVSVRCVWMCSCVLSKRAAAALRTLSSCACVFWPLQSQICFVSRLVYLYKGSVSCQLMASPHDTFSPCSWFINHRHVCRTVTDHCYFYLLLLLFFFWSSVHCSVLERNGKIPAVFVPV